ncbi:hypothetical protein [Nocardia caishijiensis]|uniref:DUF8176 domain-containing protein n=1 Tax=Nocardia caishijiensis TaxID=184756 RepID=A0ABQ6YP09_9NOCA|nr:hypothetical protein [Nocardia caishijiensis]KAF0847510.1 hypothetical protein FNL39_103408 [Nocardia caishijiensis]
MLKSYNELSRWYSALEPETDTADPARQDTTDQVAADDEAPARYSQRPERAPTAEPPADPVARPGQSWTKPDPDVVETSAEDFVDRDFTKPEQTPGSFDPVPCSAEQEPTPRTEDPRWEPDPVPVAGFPTRERDSFAVADRERTHGTDDDAESGANEETPRDETEIDYYAVEQEPAPIMEARPYVPEPVPLAEHAARRSEFTGGWADWVDHAPGPEDDYDAELVQFPWADPADDYDEAHVLEPSGALRERRTRQRNRSWVVLAIAVLVLVVAATGVMFLLFGRGNTHAAQPATPLHFTAGNLTADTVGACPTERTELVVRSAEAGGTGSGPDAVLAFQYAYYVTRSGTAARAVVTPDAEVSSAAVIQRGIDSIPVGTTHCVRITTVAPDRYTVEVTEFRPAGAPATYTKQLVRTTRVGDRTLIAGIAAG